MSLLSPRKPRAAVAAPPAASAPATADRMLRIAETAHMVGLCKSSIYRLIRAGKFPAPTKRSARAATWRLSDLQAYIRGEYQPAATAPVLALVRSTKAVRHG